MLETFVKERGFYYLIIAFCALGVVVKAYESKIYDKLLKAVENPERTEHPFMKQLKLKYKNYYKLEREIHNVDAFIETSLFRYKDHFIGLEGLHTITSRIMLLCIMASCAGVAMCVHFHMDTGMLMYHILAGALAVAGLELIEQQFGNESKKRMLFVSLKDYLENVLSNHMDNLEKGKKEMELAKKSETMLKSSDKKEMDKAKQQIAASKNAEKKAKQPDKTGLEKKNASIAQEKVIEEVIKEFFA